MDYAMTFTMLRTMAEEIANEEPMRQVGGQSHTGSGNNIISTNGGAFVNGNVHNSGGINIMGGNVGRISYTSTESNVTKAYNLVNAVLAALEGKEARYTVLRRAGKSVDKVEDAQSRGGAYFAYYLILAIEALEALV